MNTYSKAAVKNSTKKNLTVPQSMPIKGREKDMVLNNAGGYVFNLDDFKMLERFLILGTEGGTYYVKEVDLTNQNFKSLSKCLQVDPKRTIDTIFNISHEGRAYKNTPALFALAVAAAFVSVDNCDNGWSDKDVRRYALEHFEKVARTGYHKFMFTDYVNKFRGWGRLLQGTYKKYFLEVGIDELTYQAMKYQQREGWKMKDLLRLAKPKTDDPVRNAVFHWIAKGELGEISEEISSLRAIKAIQAFQTIRETNDEEVIFKLVEEYNLPFEAIPSEKQVDKIWEKMVEVGGLTWLFRNMSNLVKRNILVNKNSSVIDTVVRRLTNKEELKLGRIHPIQVLLAIKNAEDVPKKVKDALNVAFDNSFKNIEPTGKKFLLALDVSGSMQMLAFSNLTASECAAGVAMCIARTEPNYQIMAFSHEFKDLDITPDMSLKDVLSKTYDLTFGGTNCALPMIYALKNKLDVDIFCIITDCETWFGDIHPTEALKKYRKQINPEAKLVVMGTASTGFTIADPNDAGMLDVVGFDSNVPVVLSEFALGNI